MDAHKLARDFAEAARAMDEAHDEPVTAQTIAERAVDLIPDADMISVTIRARRGRFVTLAATDELARQLDELQYTLGEGPCLEAATAAEWLVSGDVGSDGRWPSWGPRAAEHGMRSLLSVQLLDHDRPIGALNLYARGGRVFSDREAVDLTVLYATHAAIALTATREVTGLNSALHSRHLIGAAQGILMERYGISLDRSFELLRRYSSQLNIPLATIAADLVERGELPGLD